jgi:hypothetical protein
MSRHPPEPEEPNTTVLVVMAYELVATSTPGVTSVKRPTVPVYHQPSKLVMQVRTRPASRLHAFRLVPWRLPDLAGELVTRAGLT